MDGERANHEEGGSIRRTIRYVNYREAVVSLLYLSIANRRQSLNLLNAHQVNRNVDDGLVLDQWVDADILTSTPTIDVVKRRGEERRITMLRQHFGEVQNCLEPGPCDFSRAKTPDNGSQLGRDWLVRQCPLLDEQVQGRWDGAATVDRGKESAPRGPPTRHCP